MAERIKDFSVLVVEDDLVTAITLCKALRTGMPEVLVLSAYSLAEAQLIMKEYAIQFFILDVNLPDGSGIEFIFDVTMHNADATIVLMTATPLPEYRDRAEAFGVMHFMAKPINHQSLLALIRQSRSSSPATAVEEDTSLFSVALSRLTVLDIIQLKCLNNTTHAVNFRSRRHGRGRVHFENGEIIHAETAHAKGMAALSEIIRWKGGYAEEVMDNLAVERTINGGWQGVLLVAAQAADERGEAEPGENPSEETAEKPSEETAEKPSEEPNEKPDDGV